MSLNKLLTYASAGFIFLFLLIGCNGGGAARGDSNTDYGQLVSGESAPTNPYISLFGGNPATMTVVMAPSSNFLFNAAFQAYVGCGGLESSTSTELAFCEKNFAYLGAESALFGTNGNPSTGMASYVPHHLTHSGVSSAKYDMITYTTPGAPYIFAGRSTPSETVSGLVILPADINGVPLPESQIKGVILYFHGAVVSKAGIPSGYGNSQTIDFLSTLLFQLEYASVFTSAGYIVAAPDYVGQGINTTPAHPFTLIPTTDAQSGIYMVSALSTYLQQKYNINLANLPSPDLFIGSYSEGGAYALRAGQLIQSSYGNIISNTGLTLKRTVGGSGAYDLSNEMLPFAFSNTTNGLTESTNPWSVSPGCNPNNNDGGFSATYGCPTESAYLQAQMLAQYQVAAAKPPLGAYMINTLVAYDYTPAAYNLVMLPAFAQQTTCFNQDSYTTTFSSLSCNALPESQGTGGYYTVQQLFSPNGLDQSQISNQLIFAAIGSTNFFIGTTTNSTELSNALAAGSAFNSVGYFVYSSLLIDPGIMALVGAADTNRWTTTGPVSLVYLSNDSTITNLNSISASQNIMPGNLVTTAPIDSTQMWADETIPGSGITAPIYINHGSIGTEGIVDMAELNQMLTNP